MIIQRVKQSVLYVILPYIGVSLLLTILHWSLVQIYATYCAPPGIMGLIYTMFNTGSPICQCINNIQVGISDNFINIWSSTSTAIIVWISAYTSLYR